MPKAGHRLALGMKLQKEVVSYQKQPSYKKGCDLKKGYGEKDYKIQGGSQEMAVMVG